MSWIAAGVALVGVASSMSAADQQADAAESAGRLSAESSRASNALQRDMYDQTREDQTPWRDTGSAALNQLAMLMGVTPSGSWSSGGRSYDDFYNKEYARQLEVLRPLYIRGSGKVSAGLLSDDAANRAREYAARAFEDEQNRVAAQQTEMERLRQSGDFGSLTRKFSMQDFEQDPGYAFRRDQGMQQIQRSAAAQGGLLSGAALKGIQRFGQDLASQEYQNAFNRFLSNQNNQFNRLASLAGVGQTANNALQTAGGNYANAVANINQNNAMNQGNAALAQGNARASGYLGAANALSGAAGMYGSMGGFGGGAGASSSYNGWNGPTAWSAGSWM